MSQKRILMLVGDYVEDYEAMVPYQMLLLAGHQVETACPGKKSGDTVKTAIHDFDGDCINALDSGLTGGRGLKQ